MVSASPLAAISMVVSVSSTSTPRLEGVSLGLRRERDLCTSHVAHSPAGLSEDQRSLEESGTAHGSLEALRACADVDEFVLEDGMHGEGRVSDRQGDDRRLHPATPQLVLDIQEFWPMSTCTPGCFWSRLSTTWVAR